jgi:hypothetical protein
MHCLVNLRNHFWTRAKVTSAWGGKKYVSIGTWTWTYRRVIRQPLAGVSRTMTIVSQPW